MLRKSSLLTAVLALALATAFAGLTMAQEVVSLGDLNKIDPAKWIAFLPSDASGLQLQGNPHLLNRTYLFTSGEYKGEYKFTCQWRWHEDPRLLAAVKQDPAKYGALRRQYADNLSIPLRSSMKLKEGRSWEPLDGLVARVDAGHGKVSTEWMGGTKGNPIAHAFIEADDQRVLTLREKGEGQEPAIKPGVWYDIEVTCRKDHLTVVFGEKTVIDADYDQKFIGGHIGMGNRETNAGIKMHSEVKNAQLVLLTN